MESKLHFSLDILFLRHSASLSIYPPTGTNIKIFEQSYLKILKSKKKKKKKKKSLFINLRF